MVDMWVANRLRLWTAMLALAASVVNILTAAEHLNEWWAYGAAFYFGAASEIFYAFVLLFAPWQYDDTGAYQPALEGRGLIFYLGGLVGVVAIIALFIATRTIGLPFLGSAARAFPTLGLLSMLARLLELALVGCLVVLMRRTRLVPLPDVSE